MFRRVGAILAGLLAGFVIVSLILSFYRSMYPPPPGLIIEDKEGVLIHMQSLPNKAFFLIMAAHTLGTYIGAFIASRVAPNHKFYYGLFVGALFVVASISYVMTVPHPGWMILTDLILVIAMAYLGARMGAKSIARQKL